MEISDEDNPQAFVKTILLTLQSTSLELDSLVGTLTRFLSWIELLSSSEPTCSSPPTLKLLNNYLPQVQRVLLTQIVVTWEPLLKETDQLCLIDIFFCPPQDRGRWSGLAAIHAYASLCSEPISHSSIRLLSLLTSLYNIDTCYRAIYEIRELNSAQAFVLWTETVAAVFSVPGKIANMAHNQIDVPTEFSQGLYLTKLCRNVYGLIEQISAGLGVPVDYDALIHLFSKMTNNGLFPLRKWKAPSDVSFFSTNMAAIEESASRSPNGLSSPRIWTQIMEELPPGTRLSVICSLFSSLDATKVDLNPSPKERWAIKQKSGVLRHILQQSIVDVNILSAVIAALMKDIWGMAIPRILVCYLFLENPKAIESTLIRVVDRWADPAHVQHSLLSYHRYLTGLLLLLVSYLEPSSKPLSTLSMSPQFISSIGIYISHLDPAVRRCGLLAAETVAEKTGKSLRFDGWDGVGEGREWARDLRTLLSSRDADIVATEDIESPEECNQATPSPVSKLSQLGASGSQVTYDSDDSLTGYGSPPSSRSPSPTPEELDEIERDPTLRVGRKQKILKPVYVSQLIEMLRPKGKDGDHESVEKLDVGLSEAAELIRRKRNFGFELAENAAELSRILLGLQDDYELDNFEKRREAALTALVVCCPQVAGPLFASEWFLNQYSVSQRFTILNALALGARELAGLSTSNASYSLHHSFPSKRLPLTLHAKYTGLQPNVVQDLLEGIKDNMLSSRPQPRNPETRTRRLRLGELPRNLVAGANRVAEKPTFSYKDLAAEYFIIPLINGFWSYMRDEQTRELRTKHTERPYQGAGNATIQSPLVLVQFLRTIGVLIHAAQNSAVYLSVLAPNTLELMLTVATTPASIAIRDDGNDQTAQETVSALEVTLIILVACQELDGCRSLALDHTALLLGIAQWTSDLLTILDNGMRLRGASGPQDQTIGRVVAAVALRVDEATSKWRRSMVDTLV
ncbi:hypothetical protein SISSUDRAFT_1013417 [Sistotremastrum suecicum HHB10207 ss-3]|uniref:Telomere length regulation protein conserved domain-containing protein n=1 Tax=Sistotremastrum suecicum HHB10207 ss-3 TaxID=1314776 RepID=A0A166IG09_9AGAM|nr:hypothetical protein SISSUDRAFT_1013417 [Sistotremastrum suecicum HHB10207 ss-3]